MILTDKLVEISGAGALGILVTDDVDVVVGAMRAVSELGVGRISDADAVHSRLDSVAARTAGNERVSHRDSHHSGDGSY